MEPREVIYQGGRLHTRRICDACDREIHPSAFCSSGCDWSLSESSKRPVTVEERTVVTTVEASDWRPVGQTSLLEVG